MSENMWHSYTGILLNRKEENVTCRKMDRSGYCHLKFNKPDSKILHVHFYAESEFLCEDSCMRV